MSWQAMYDKKLRSIEEAATYVKSGDRVFICGSTSTPYKLVDAVVARADELKGVLMLGMLTAPPKGYDFKLMTTPGLDGKINFESQFLFAADKVGLPHGHVTYNPVPLGKIGWALKHNYNTNVLMLNVTYPDDEGNMSFGAFGAGWGGEVIEYCEKIVVCVNKHMPKVVGMKSSVHISQVDCICEDHVPFGDFVQAPVTDVEQKIADYILEYIPDNACLQVGFGGLSNAVAYGLSTRKNLSINTEMFTDSICDLIKKGAVTGPVLTGFALGSNDIYEFCAQDDTPVRYAPITYTNDFDRISKIENLVSVNACLMADFTGQVCSEAIGWKQYSSIGGQVEFVRGATASPGGKSFICTASSFIDKDGVHKSKINAILPPGSVITTSRSDVQYIATEYGVAYLYYKGMEDRIKSMIAIAHPEFRDDLHRQAVEMGLLRR